MITYGKLGKYGQLGNQMFQIASTIGLADKYQLEYSFPEWEYTDCISHNLTILHDNWFAFGLLASHFTTLKEKDINKIPTCGEFINLEGYYQDSKYFENSDIKSMFQPAPHIKLELEQKYDFKEYTSIHVRRGDYLKYPEHHPNLTMEYYNEAMSKMKGPFLVFSDDIEWCKENFIDVEFVEEDWPDIYDLYGDRKSVV